MTINFNQDNFSKKQIWVKLFDLLSALSPDPKDRLQDSEIALLSEFLILPENTNTTDLQRLPRTRVLKDVKATGWDMSRTNLNNKLYSIIDKGYLTRDEDGVIYFSSHIRPIVENILDNNTQMFNLKFNIANA